MDIREVSRSIFDRSLFVHERRDLRFVADQSTDPVPLPEDLINRWCKTLGLNGLHALIEDLKSRGITLNQLTTRFDQNAIDPKKYNWIDLLQPLCEMFSHGESFELALDNEAHALSSLTEYIASTAWILVQQLAKLVEFVPDIIADTALVDLGRNFRTRFTRVLKPTLTLEVQILRSRRQASTSRGDSEREPVLINGSWWVALLGKYPVLARYLALVIDRWLINSRTMLERLKQDYSLLEMHTVELGEVARISEDLSDMHNDNQSVLGLTFRNSQVWYYKPRSLSADALHLQLLRWVSSHGGPNLLVGSVILDRGTYGWMSGVTSKPCENWDEISLFYERMGMHLCIAHMFSMVDLHFENFVAHGCCPVVIDAETFLTPDLARSTNGSPGTSMEACYRALWQNSVFRTSILPRWLAADDASRDGSAALQLMTSVKAQKGHNHPRTQVILGSLPALAEGYVSAERYVPNILSGFAVMASFLISHRLDLLNDSEFWSRANSINPRVVFRQTRVYAQMCNLLLHPSNLESGIHASIQTDKLFMNLLPQRHDTQRAIVAEEQQMLLKLDVPYFTGHSLALLSEKECFPIEHIFAERAINSVKRRLETFSDRDVVRQQALIRTGLVFDDNCHIVYKANRSDDATRITSSSWVESGPVERQLGQSTELRCEHTQACEEAIWNAAIFGADGTPGWIGKIFHKEVGGWRVFPLGISLFDGTVGVLKFLASCQASRDVRDEIRCAYVVGAIKEVVTSRLNSLERGKSGIGFGIGGVLWGLSSISNDLPEYNLAALIEELIANLQTDLLFAGPAVDDVLTGRAGLLLALETLSASAFHIDLEAETNRAWPFLAQAAAEKRAMNDKTDGFHGAHVGMAHGLAGVALAMLKTAKRIHDEPRVCEVLDHYKYINLLHRRWLALPRRDQVKSFQGVGPLSWCNGLTGSAISSLAAYAIHPDPEIIEAIPDLLNSIAQWPLGFTDTLCCGNSGRAGLFRFASQVLGQRVYTEIAEALLVSMLSRVSHPTAFNLGVSPDFINPTLYQGLAGVAQALSSTSAIDLLTWGVPVSA